MKFARWWNGSWGAFNQEFGEERTIAPQAVAVMESYGFAGNVRELRNLIAPGGFGQRPRDRP